ncbi:MAG TPA: archease [Methanocella sp.]|nr:archease [Methanocella sp.]
MDYEYLEHTADAEFIAYGKTLDEAFVNAARATFALIIDPARVKQTVSRDVHLTDGSLDYLLYDWLSELLYIEEVDRIVFSRFEVEISGDGEYVLDGRAHGEKIRPEHEISLHIKAVTYHDLRVEKRDDKFEVQVLLDI